MRERRYKNGDENNWPMHADMGFRELEVGLDVNRDTFASIRSMKPRGHANSGMWIGGDH